MTDTTNAPTLPITVNDSAAPGQIGSAVRSFLLALGGYMVGKGWIDQNLMMAAVPVILLAGPLIWGQIKASQTHQDAKAMATALPDSTAKVV